MSKWPRIRYHKEKSPDGRLVQSEELAPLGPGWSDSPDFGDESAEAPSAPVEAVSNLVPEYLVQAEAPKPVSPKPAPKRRVRA